MPKLKPTPQKAAEQRVVANIRGLGAKNGCRFDCDIARRANISVSTFYKKMSAPRTLRLDDMFQIAAAFKEPLTALFKEV